MTVAVETKDVSKTYAGGVRAVRGADIRVEAGELMVLVGPSGCGKTTLLRMIAGLERITSGEILVGERVVNNVAPSKRGVALVFQNFALYPHKTASENIAFPLESAGVQKVEIQQRVAAVAKMLELTTQLDRRPGELSGGQQQRVALHDDGMRSRWLPYKRGTAVGRTGTRGPHPSRSAGLCLRRSRASPRG